MIGVEPDEVSLTIFLKLPSDDIQRHGLAGINYSACDGSVYCRKGNALLSTNLKVRNLKVVLKFPFSMLSVLFCITL